MLDGSVTDLLEAEAITYNNQYIDIYSASWGPTDDGKTLEGPHRYCQRALHEGVTKGRNGKGSIYVWATGNGGSVGDDCSCDGYVSSIYTLSVGCISDRGLSTYFSEVCPSTMAVVFTGGSHSMPGENDYRSPKIKVVTTDLNKDCTLEFQGTSSAAPLAAGCVALVLEANNNVTWRDVQNIVVETARIPNDQEDGWTVNGGGYHVNHHFGFGALDCGRMVEAAQRWITVQDQHVCSAQHESPTFDIYPNRKIHSLLISDGCYGDAKQQIDHLEHVQVEVEIEHARRGDLSLVLMSPDGTKSNILSRRPLDDSTEGIHYTFMTVHHWGEDPSGTWTLLIEDHPKQETSSNTRRGRLIRWSLILYGVAGVRPNHVQNNGKTSDQHRSFGNAGNSEQARLVSTDEIKDLMADEGSKSVKISAKDEEETENTRRWLEKKGLSARDVEYLMSLYKTERERRRQLGSRYSEGADETRSWPDSYREALGHRSQEYRSRREADENIESKIVDMDVADGSLQPVIRELMQMIADNE